MADEGTDYKTGDKVWAKLPGYPHWPGRVEEPKNMRERKKIPPGYFLIFFYGTHETAIMARNELFDWNDENNKMWFAERDTVYFTDSLWEVENDPNVKRDAPLPGITAAPNLQEVNKYNPIVPPTLSDDELGDLAAGADSSDSDSSGSESGSSSSSSSSSDSEFEKKKKERRKQASNKKKTAQAKVKLSKPRKRKASSSSGSEVENANVSSSSDDEAEKKFAKLTAAVPKKSPKTSATFIPKVSSSASPSKPLKSETKSSAPSKPKDAQKKPAKVKKTGNSSDEEEALKKFAEKSENDETNSQKSEPEKIDTAQAESNLAAFLSESDENESRTDKKNKTSPSKGKMVENDLPPSPVKDAEAKKPETSPKKDAKLVDSEDDPEKSPKTADKELVKSEQSAKSEEEKSSPKKESKKEEKEDKQKREKEKSPKSKLKKRLEKHQEKIDRERQERKDAAAEKAKTDKVESKFNNRRSIIEDSDSSNDESTSGSKSSVKRTSAIVPDVHKLTTDKILDKLHFELMKSLSQKCLNHERALTCLNEMKDYLTSDNLRKNTDVFISIKKIRKYKKDDKVQHKAEELFNMMKSLVTSNTDVSEQLSSKLQEERKKRHSEAPQQNKTPGSETSDGSQVSVTSTATNDKDSKASSILAPIDDATNVEAAKNGDQNESTAVQSENQVESSIEGEDSIRKVESSKLDNVNNTANDVNDAKTDADGQSSTPEQSISLNKGSNKPAVQYFFMRGSADAPPVAGSPEVPMDVDTSYDVTNVASEENGRGSNSVDQNGGHTPTRDEIEDTANGDHSLKSEPMLTETTNSVKDLRMGESMDVSSQPLKTKSATNVVPTSVSAADGIDIDSALGI